jgi:hypothetical protein
MRVFLTMSLVCLSLIGCSGPYQKACDSVCACKTVNQGCSCGTYKSDCKCEKCSCVSAEEHVTVPNSNLK